MANPIRVFEGTAEPYAKFWQWEAVPLAAAEGAENTGKIQELRLYGPISEFSWFDDAITPAKFAKDLADYGQGDAIRVRLHSPGGEQFAASAIASMLADYPGRVTVRVDGLAASAAVLIALAGDYIEIADSAFVMIHNPRYRLLSGNLDAPTLAALQDNLLKFALSLAESYANRTGIALDRVAAMMDSETWLTAAEAVETGFADSVFSPKRQLDPGPLNYFENAPAALSAQVVNLAAGDQSPLSVVNNFDVAAMQQRIEKFL